MKKLRKITALAISVIMLLSVSLPAVAAEGDPTNLALGKAVTSTAYIGDKGTGYTADLGGAQCEADTEARLTDGVFSDGLCWDGKNTAFYRGVGRSVVVSLGAESTVKSINIDFLQDTAYGITVPEDVNFSISNDGGKTWSYLGKVSKKDVTTIITRDNVPDIFDGQEVHAVRTTQYYRYEIKDLNYLADSVKLDFDTTVWAFSDELQVMGKTGAVDGAVVATTGGFDPVSFVNQFPAPGSEQVRGIHDDYLAYSGWNNADGTITKYDKTYKDFLPVVGYLDKTGKAKDFMFDSVLFISYNSASSGHDMLLLTADQGKPEKASTKADWQEYADNVFNLKGMNLDALNQAVEDVKTQLKDKDYKVHFKISIPKALASQNNFGSVVEGGPSLNFNQKEVGDAQALANETAAEQWYMDYVIGLWNEKSALYGGNLVFDGFYWYEEEINTSESDHEYDLVKSVTDYAHSKNLVVNWIPCNQAAGWYKWKQMGFDYAVMQPNLPFGDYPSNQPTLTADMAKKFGLGVEMEIHWFGLTQDKYRDMYLQYLNQGITAGYMTGSYHAWYQGTDSLQQMYNSTRPSDRELYDFTYQFIKGTYKKQLLSTELENLSLNMPITSTVAVPDGNQDPKAEQDKLKLLVDGDEGTADWWDGKHVGFLQGGGRTVTIDLKGTRTIKSLGVVAVADSGSGVHLPEKVTFLVSNDKGKTWVNVGDVYKSDAVSCDQGYKYEVTGFYTGNYIRIEFPVLDGWVFLGEIEVSGRSKVLDGAKAPTGYVNLAYRKPISRVVKKPNKNDDSAIWQQKEPYSLFLLDDGNVPAQGWNRLDHVGFANGGGRSIIINLQSTNTIKEINVLASQDEGSGINLPASMTFYVSKNGGKGWIRVGTVKSSSATSCSSDYMYSLSKLNLTGNTVRVDFDVTGGWVFLSEIQVLGKCGT